MLRARARLVGHMPTSTGSRTEVRRAGAGRRTPGRRRGAASAPDASSSASLHKQIAVTHSRLPGEARRRLGRAPADWVGPLGPCRLSGRRGERVTCVRAPTTGRAGAGRAPPPRPARTGWPPRVSPASTGSRRSPYLLGELDAHERYAVVRIGDEVRAAGRGRARSPEQISQRAEPAQPLRVRDGGVRRRGRG